MKGSRKTHHCVHLNNSVSLTSYLTLSYYLRNYKCKWATFGSKAKHSRNTPENKIKQSRARLRVLTADKKPPISPQLVGLVLTCF